MQSAGSSTRTMAHRPHGPIRSFGRWGEDLLVVELLNRRRGGIYLDIGCDHPAEGSRTALLSSAYGWRGLNVATTAAALAAHERARPGDVNRLGGAPGLHLAALLSAEADALPPADYLNVGYGSTGTAALVSVNWNRQRPRLVSLDDPKLRLDGLAESAAYVFLRALGYDLVSRAGPVSVFAREA